MTPCYATAMRPSVLPLLVCALTACGTCGGESSDDPVVITLPEPDVRVMVITDLQGVLEPCGCTSRALGGIDRMAAAVDGAGEDVLFLASGDLLYGTTGHASGPEAGEQDRWRAETAAEILVRIGLDATNPGAEDAAASDFDAVCQEASVPVIAEGRVFEVSGHRVGVVAADHAEGVAEQIAALDSPEVVVVLASGQRRLARSLAEIEGVDLVVQGGVDREEPSPPVRAGSAHIIHAGRQGQHLVQLDLYLGGTGELMDVSAWSHDVRRGRLQTDIDDLRSRIEAWQAEGQDAAQIQTQQTRLGGMETELQAMNAPQLVEGRRAFSAIPLELPPDAARSTEVQEQLERYDVRVNDHNERVYADRAPPEVEEGAAHYVGSASCGNCHWDAYQWWESHPHGRAYATLTERNKEFHLECVACHVTGYELPGGSTVTQNQDGALTNVGCEVCHGPGSLHVRNPPAADMQREVPERVCVGCHNEEHSDLFVYDAYRSTLLVPGHGMPAE